MNAGLFLYGELLGVYVVPYSPSRKAGYVQTISLIGRIFSQVSMTRPGFMGCWNFSSTEKFLVGLFGARPFFISMGARPSGAA